MIEGSQLGVVISGIEEGRAHDVGRDRCNLSARQAENIAIEIKGGPAVHRSQASREARLVAVVVTPHGASMPSDVRQSGLIVEHLA